MKFKSLLFVLFTLIPLFVVEGKSKGEKGVLAPKPVFRDNIYDGAADPLIVWNRKAKQWYMFYTNRRANVQGIEGVAWVHGTPIGIAVSKDGANWKYKTQANIEYKPDGGATYWAPSVVDDGKEYHMYLTYVPGIFKDWNRPRVIIHLTSNDLLNWKYISTLPLATQKVIDADVLKMPDGSWRMWYNNEVGGKRIYFADSPDLYTWTDKGIIGDINRSEGPKVFKWKGSYWMINDEWRGMSVYNSPDATIWRKQKERILEHPGKGQDDGVIGGHCEVIVSQERAFVYYFVHPGRTKGVTEDSYNTRRSSIQVTELFTDDGRTIYCDRDKPTYVRIKPNKK